MLFCITNLVKHLISYLRVELFEPVIFPCVQMVQKWEPLELSDQRKSCTYQE